MRGKKERIVNGKKRCSRCLIEKDLSEFSPNPRRGVYYPTSQCKECKNAIEKARYKHDPRAGRARSRRNGRKHQLRQKYNLSVENYNDKLNAQGGVCAICGKPESAKSRDGNVRALSVDHCHVTGIVRDLLCHSCNRILGFLKDNPDHAKAVVTYLLKWGGE